MYYFWETFSCTVTEKDDLMDFFSLTVIDVYNEWSGPCKCMVSIFKKAKLDLGDKLYKPAIVSWFDSICAKDWKLITHTKKNFPNEIFTPHMQVTHLLKWLNIYIYIYIKIVYFNRKTSLFSSSLGECFLSTLLPVYGEWSGPKTLG